MKRMRQVQEVFEELIDISELSCNNIFKGVSVILLIEIFHNKSAAVLYAPDRMSQVMHKTCCNLIHKCNAFVAFYFFLEYFQLMHHPVKGISYLLEFISGPDCNLFIEEVGDAFNR